MEGCVPDDMQRLASIDQHHTVTAKEICTSPQDADFNEALT